MNVPAMLRQVSGLNLSKEAVERAVRQRMASRAGGDRDAYLAALTPEELGQLLELVVVPESWLFRDRAAFTAATGEVRARLDEAGAERVVRILSIPCACGEEPYSMAMALCDAGVPGHRYSIDAYDISAACVLRARAGVYGRNAFRGRDLAFRERHFSREGDDYRISGAVRAAVRVEQGNLLTLDCAGRTGYYDLIFCRNLLIYFDPASTTAAIARLGVLLRDDGVLFAGYAEVPTFCQRGYAPLRHTQAFGLVKQTAPRQRADVAAPARPLASRPERPERPPRPTTPTTPPPPAEPVGAPAENLLEQARVLADRGQLQPARACCQAWLAQSPESAAAYFLLGLLSENDGDTARAAQHWRRCIYLQPDHYEALCHLALLAERQHDPAAAALKARAARVYQRRAAH